MDDETRGRAANLTVGPKYTKHEPFHRSIDVDIGENDDWAFSAELKGDVLDVARGGSHHPGTCGNTACERELVDEGMLCKR